MDPRRGGDSADDQLGSRGDKARRPDSRGGFSGRDTAPGSDLWKDGLICAFEYVRGRKRSGDFSKPGSKLPSRGPTKVDHSKVPAGTNGGVVEAFPQAVSRKCDSEVAAGDDYGESPVHELGQFRSGDRLEGGHWVPIGWERILALAQTAQVDAGWGMQLELMDDSEDLTAADMAAPYWERPAGPVWWCHFSEGHPAVEAWLSNAQWLHPAVSLALRDEGRLISERMKHLLYEVNLLLGPSLGVYCYW